MNVDAAEGQKPKGVDPETPSHEDVGSIDHAADSKGWTPKDVKQITQDMLREHGANIDFNVRQEIHFEHTLISQRMGWFAAFQAFLFSAYALASGEPYDGVNWLPKIAIPSIGAGSCLFAFISLGAAILVLVKWGRIDSVCDRAARCPSWLRTASMVHPLIISFGLAVVWVWVGIAHELPVDVVPDPPPAISPVEEVTPGGGDVGGDGEVPARPEVR
ncbi:MAG: hypothetical protein AAGA29_05015 [Planctomycetota bacterium]